MGLHPFLRGPNPVLVLRQPLDGPAKWDDFPLGTVLPTRIKLKSTDYGLYRCRGCGKRVKGFEKDDHVRHAHGEIDPGYVKLG